MTILELNNIFFKSGLHGVIDELYKIPISELEELIKILPDGFHFLLEFDEVLHKRYQWDLDGLCSSCGHKLDWILMENTYKVNCNYCNIFRQ